VVTISLLDYDEQMPRYVIAGGAEGVDRQSIDTLAVSGAWMDRHLSVISREAILGANHWNFYEE